jgi:hypothetical protein
MELGKRMTLTRRVAVGLVAAVLLGVPIVAGLVRTAVVVAAFAPSAGRVPLLQIQDPPRQSFEVASVKPNNSGETTSFLQPRPGGNFAVGNMTLRGLIMFAYGIQGFQLVGVPEWVATERFDITAKAAADIPPTPIGQTSPEALMLRSLLEDRFRLSVHRETRDLPIYALVLARADGRLGPRLRQTTSDFCKKLFEAASKAGNTPVPPGGPFCGMRPLGSDERIRAFLERRVWENRGRPHRSDRRVGFRLEVVAAQCAEPRSRSPLYLHRTAGAAWSSVRRDHRTGGGSGD